MPNPMLLPELFQCVLECLVVSLPERPSKEERCMLAVLARTCRAFSEPSLDCLWRRLNSLLPLMRCFSEVVEEACAKTPPSAGEWTSIHRYSHRIQELTLGNEPLSLHFLKVTGLVLPNLRTFRWEVGNFNKPPYPPKSITHPEYQMFLDNFPTLCPNLTSVKFYFRHGPQDREHIAPALIRALCAKSDWRHIELSPPVDNAVLKHLALSSALKTVSLTLVPLASQLDETLSGHAETPFSSVRDLALTLWNSLDSIACLLRPREQMFRSFKVTLRAVTLATEVTSFVTALATPQRVQSLQSVDISHSHDVYAFTGQFAHERHRQPLVYETFRPLASLVHLHKLVIRLNHPISINDEELSSLVCNWPLLEVFTMCWVPAENPAMWITLKGLLSLLSSCPKLYEIDMTLDARDVPVETEVDICRPSITLPLCFHNSPLKDADLVAAFLMKHLPSIPRVWTLFICDSFLDRPLMKFDFDRQQCAELWKQVNNRMGVQVA